MINRQPPVISHDALIDEAIAQIVLGGKGYAVVLEAGKPKGILTEAQILAAIALSPPRSLQVAEIVKPFKLTMAESQTDVLMLLSVLEKSQTQHIAILAPNGNLAGVIAEIDLLRTLSQNCQIEDEEQKQFQRFTQEITLQIIETSPNILYIHDLGTRSTSYTNSRVKDILGYSPSQFTQILSSTEFIHPDDLDRVNHFYLSCRTLSEGKVIEIEFRVKHADGRWLWLNNRHASFQRNSDGLVEQTLVVSQDITTSRESSESLRRLNEELEAHISDRTEALRQTNQELLMEIAERKLIEVALREGEEKFRHVFEDSPIGMSLFGLDGKHLQVNQALCHLLEYTESELKRLTAFEITYPSDIPRERNFIKQMLQGSINHYRIEKRFLKRNREIIWVNMSAAVVRDHRSGDIRYGIGMVEDISDRKIAEEELRQSEERFRSIFEEGPLGMAIIRFNQRVIKVNAMLCQMLGYTELELLSQPFKVIDHPEDVNIDHHLAKELYYGRIPSYQVEKRCIKKNQEVIWVALTASVVKDRKGKTIYGLAMLKDITKQKLAQDLIANSLAEKEVLLKEVHHRVKNNLHVIANLLDLQSQCIQDPEILELFNDSQNRIHSMALIHEQLCLSPRLEQIDFDIYIKNLVDNLFSSYGVNHQQIKCAIEVAPVKLGLEKAIPCGLILNELISNSLKYAFPSHRLEQGRCEILIQLDQSRESKGLLDFVVSDNGIGIAPDLDWYNTGSLGLRLVRILTRQLDGTIQLERDHGTTFRLNFAELKT